MRPPHCYQGVNGLADRTSKFQSCDVYKKANGNVLNFVAAFASWDLFQMQLLSLHSLDHYSKSSSASLLTVSQWPNCWTWRKNKYCISESINFSLASPFQLSLYIHQWFQLQLLQTCHQSTITLAVTDHNYIYNLLPYSGCYFPHYVLSSHTHLSQSVPGFTPPSQPVDKDLDRT